MAFRKGQSGNRATQFRKGESGNPGGRPKSKPISEALLELLGVQPKRYKKLRPKTVAGQVAKRMIDDAVKGVTSLIREVLDRTEGKVPLPIMADTGPIDVNVRIHHIGAQPRHRATAPTN